MTTYKLTCQCGWETTGDEDQIVERAQQHGRDLHNMDVSHDQAMAMASPVEG